MTAHRLGGWQAGLASLALVGLSACGQGAPGDRACPGSALRQGIGLDIDAPLAAKVGTATLTACWAGSCRTPAVQLIDSTVATGTTCTGTGPDAACAARAVPTGGKSGFADLSDLPASAVTVTVTLLDASGTPLVDQTLEITPAIAYPHGPECGGGTPQSTLTVAADGTVSEERR